MCRLPMLVCVTWLASCANGAWQNPHIANEEAKRAQLRLDAANCSQVAAGSIPIPPIRVYQPNYDGPYSFDGTIETYVSGVGTVRSDYSGTVRSTPNAAESFATGFASGAEIGSAMVASSQRNSMMDSCMAQLGWIREGAGSEFFSRQGNRDAAAIRGIDMSKVSRSGKADSNVDSQVKALPWWRMRGNQPFISLKDVPDEVLDDVEELRAWRDNYPERWVRAIELDEEFRSDPTYVTRSLHDRLHLVVSHINAFGHLK